MAGKIQTIRATPEKYAGFAYKVGLNYFIYDLTH